MNIPLERKEKFEPGENVIWDSGFGYELATFEKENGVMYGTHQIEITTGKYQGVTSLPISEIYPNTPANLEILKQRYDK